MGMPKLDILEGDLIKADTDVCVCSVHRSKNLTIGELASYVYQHAGEAVQGQFNGIQREMSHGEVFRTDAGNLRNFKFLLFCCLYYWRQGNEKALRKVVKECCEIASDLGARSIAFPCLGTGGLKYPVKEAAAAMMAGIVDFWVKSKSQDTSLERIVIILPERKDPEWLKRFVFICAKQMHMFNMGLRASEASLPEADQGGFEVFIHDYEKLVSPKASRPQKSGSSTVSTSSSGLPIAFNIPLIQMQKSFGPLIISGAAGVHVSGGISVDFNILKKFIPTGIANFFGLK